MMVEEEEATDFVFRVVTAFRPENLREFGKTPSHFIITVRAAVYCFYRRKVDVRI